MATNTIFAESYKFKCSVCKFVQRKNVTVCRLETPCCQRSICTACVRKNEVLNKRGSFRLEMTNGRQFMLPACVVCKAKFRWRFFAEPRSRCLADYRVMNEEGQELSPDETQYIRSVVKSIAFVHPETDVFASNWAQTGPWATLSAGEIVGDWRTYSIVPPDGHSWPIRNTVHQKLGENRAHATETTRYEED